jgi:DNA-binding response OmpR family regulator
MDGRDLCRLVRRRGMKLPILLVTALAAEADLVLGLDSGANDYLVKPFRAAVLLANIRALLRQHELSDDATFTIGPYRFRPATKLLVDHTHRRKVLLTEREAAIVKFLYRMGDRPVARATLLDEVWGYNARVETHTLETHIYRLRQKIELTPRQPTLLLTEEGGYRLKR